MLNSEKPVRELVAALWFVFNKCIFLAGHRQEKSTDG